MVVPIWYIAFAGLSLMLTGVSTEIDLTRTTVRPSPSSNGRQETPNGKSAASSIQVTNDVFAFACTSVCGNSGKVLECELKTNGECAKRYYVVCKGKDQCQWETIKSSCDEEKANQDECEKLLRDRDAATATAEKIRRRSETGISYLRSVGIVPALRRRLSSVRRRDLGEKQPYTARSGMAMTSGNAHAYALNNNNMVESHYGRPATYSSRPDNDVLGFPFSFLSRFPNFNKQRYIGGHGSPPSTGAMAISPKPVEQTETNKISRDPVQSTQAAGPPQTVNNWSGYQPIPYSPIGGYTAVEHYPRMYQQPNGYNQAYAYSANDDYNMWGSRPRPYSPFTSFFNAVGLQDPMLLLQYLPVG